MNDFGKAVVLLGAIVAIHGVTSKAWKDAHTAAVIGAAVLSILSMGD